MNVVINAKGYIVIINIYHKFEKNLLNYMITVLDGITYLPVEDRTDDLDPNIYINNIIKGFVKGLEGELIVASEEEYAKVIITGDIFVIGNLVSIAGLEFSFPEDLSRIARGIIDVGDSSIKLRAGFILN